MNVRKKSILKKIFIGIGFALIVMQFIQPARNSSGQVLPTDISKMYTLPQNVQQVLQVACYDCHSNNTRYPWYSNIQPLGWWQANHIKNGKENLNFSEFGSYTLRKKINKLKGIENSIKDGTMPLSSYTLIHKNARLSSNEKTLLMDWTKKLKDSLTSIK